MVYFIDGIYQSDEYIGTTCINKDDGNGAGGGGGSAPSSPPPPQCPAGSHPGSPVIPPCSLLNPASVGVGQLTINNIPPPPPPNDGGMPPPSSQVACSVDPPAQPCPVVEDPCAQAKRLAQDIVFKSKMNELKSKTSLDKEVGYYTSAQGSYTSVQGASGTAGINFTVATPISRYIHTHYTGTFPTFSVFDVLSIYDLQKDGNIADINTFTAGVVTASGTTYLMKISDPAKFATFAAANLSNNADIINLELIYKNQQTAYKIIM